jgi:hypothetical protein
MTAVVGIKHFAPSIIFVEEFCRINTGIVDAYVKLSEDVVVAGIGGSQLICITNITNRACMRDPHLQGKASSEVSVRVK